MDYVTHLPAPLKKPWEGVCVIMVTSSESLQMRTFILLSLFLPTPWFYTVRAQQTPSLSPDELVAVLDTVYQTEQNPIRLRDSLLTLYGAESEEVQKQQRIYEQNHAINEKVVRDILDNSGWPEKHVVGERGNLTICNVLQHSANEVRIKYLPMMKAAVLAGQLHPRFLVRAEDRIATEAGELQIYGGQMKYYPETASFNVWPVYDPANINKRRAEIGLGTIEEHLRERFDFEWNLEEQIGRTRKFMAAKNKTVK